MGGWAGGGVEGGAGERMSGGTSGWTDGGLDRRAGG